MCDQLDVPAPEFSVFFNSAGGDSSPNTLINKLFEDSHQNNVTPNTKNFYLRIEAWDGKTWVNRLPDVNGVRLEIDGVDLLTRRVLYLPLRYDISAEHLQKWIAPHRTTVVDVELLRLPAAVSFILSK